MHTYAVYGLKVASAFPLPGLRRANGRVADAVIRFGRLDPEAKEAMASGVNFRVTEEGDYIFVPEVATFLITRDEIVIDRAPGVDDGRVRVALLGSPLGVLAQRHGYFVLHASAVAIGGDVVSFVGDTRAGKSTTAAAMHARGHTFISDDEVVLRLDGGTPLVFPGPPQLKLWHETASTFGHDPSQLQAIDPRLDKGVKPVTTRYESEALRLAHIFLLRDGDRHEIRRASGAETVIELVRHSYCVLLLDRDEAAAHLRSCAGLGRAVPVDWLVRPRNLAELPRTLDFVEQTVAATKHRARDDRSHSGDERHAQPRASAAT